MGGFCGALAAVTVPPQTSSRFPSDTAANWLRPDGIEASCRQRSVFGLYANTSLPGEGGLPNLGLADGYEENLAAVPEGSLAEAIAGRGRNPSPPIGRGAVVIATRPETAEETMRECAELGIKHVWMHRGPGAGSVSKPAADYGRQQGIAVIDGGCPCMFEPTADFGHKAMPLIFTVSGNVPKQV